MIFVQPTNSAPTTYFSISTIAGTGNNGVYDNYPASLAWLVNPTGVWGDTFGNIYVTDSGHSRVRKFTSDGLNSSTLQSTACVDLWGDSVGNLFVSRSGQVNKIVLSTNTMTTYYSNLGTPRGMSGDTAGNLYAADDQSCSVWKISTVPDKTRIMGGTCSYDTSSGNFIFKIV